MAATKRILKFFTIPLAINVGLIGIVFMFLLLSGTLSLTTLGNILLYLGIGIVILGFAVISFRRTGADIHMRHQGTEAQQRRKAQTELAEYHIGFAIALAGLILSTIGWLMLHIAVCGRLYCG